MLCLFLDTPVIGHSLNGMLSILNEKALQNEWHHYMADNVFASKKFKTQQQQNKNANQNFIFQQTYQN